MTDNTLPQTMAETETVVQEACQDKLESVDHDVELDMWHETYQDGTPGVTAVFTVTYSQRFEVPVIPGQHTEAELHDRIDHTIMMMDRANRKP